MVPFARRTVGRLFGYFDHRFADLHRRLDVVEIEVKVVRERVDDLARLVREGHEHASIDAETLVALVDDLERAVRALPGGAAHDDVVGAGAGPDGRP